MQGAGSTHLRWAVVRRGQHCGATHVHIIMWPPPCISYETCRMGTKRERALAPVSVHKRGPSAHTHTHTHTLPSHTSQDNSSQRARMCVCLLTLWRCLPVSVLLARARSLLDARAQAHHCVFFQVLACPCAHARVPGCCRCSWSGRTAWTPPPAPLQLRACASLCCAPGHGCPATRPCFGSTW